MLQAFAVGTRVGILQLRRSPDRLVNRFGTIAEGCEAVNRSDDLALVQWDDGELNYAEKGKLRSMREMGDNPRNLPVIDFLTEIQGKRSATLGPARRRSFFEEFESMPPLRKFAFTLSL